MSLSTSPSQGSHVLADMSKLAHLMRNSSFWFGGRPRSRCATAVSIRYSWSSGGSLEAVGMGRIWEGGLAAWSASAVAVVVVVVAAEGGGEGMVVRWELGVQVCERLALLLELRPSVHGAHHCVRQVEHDQLSTPLLWKLFCFLPLHPLHCH